MSPQNALSTFAAMTLPRCLILPLWLALAAGCAAPPRFDAASGLYELPVDISQRDFAPGDDIVVQQVLASTSKPAVGDKIIVRGTYRLQSAPDAKLLLTLSTTQFVRVPTLPAQTQQVTGGSGEFEVTIQPLVAGTLHLSFYPAGGGGPALGGVLFGPDIR